jgi:hypothetical protein
MTHSETEGWNALTAQERAGAQTRRAEMLERYRVDTLFARVFGGGEGGAVLAILRAQTIEQPAWIPGQHASFGFAREGQNSLVREIERRMARARLGPPGDDNQEVLT